MSEDELIFAIAAVHGDIGDLEKSLSKSVENIASYNKTIAQYELLYKSTRESLEFLVKQRIILIDQFNRMRKEMRYASVKLEEAGQWRAKCLASIEKYKKQLPELRKQLNQLENQLDNFVPPRTVLEFIRHD